MRNWIAALLIVTTLIALVHYAGTPSERAHKREQKLIREGYFELREITYSNDVVLQASMTLSSNGTPVPKVRRRSTNSVTVVGRHDDVRRFEEVIRKLDVPQK